MVNSYVERRREYVADIRSSFDAAEGEEDSYEDGMEGMAFLFSKLRLLASAVLFVGFLYLLYTGTYFCGFQAKDIIEVVSDGHYYTELKEYVGAFRESGASKDR